MAVIGGGISGLSTCYYLNKLSANYGLKIHVNLIEADDRLGGKILTDIEDELVIDGGPDSFFSQKPWAMELCEELGLSGDLVDANRETRGTFILNHGKLSKLPEGTESGMPTKLRPFVSTDLISLPGKFRALMDIVIPRKKNLEDESIGSFMGRRFGKQFLVKIVEPLYAGIYAGDVYHLSAKSSLPSLVAMETAHGSLIRAMRELRKTAGANTNKKGVRSRPPTFVSLKGGMIQMIDAIVSRMGNTEVILRTRVFGIRERKQGSRNRYRVTFEGGKHLDVDAVVLAVPAYSASNMIRDLDQRISSILDTIPYVSTATVALTFRRDDIKKADGVKGHGFLVPRSEEEMVTGCTWESSKWPVHASPGTLLARCYVGWFGHEEFASLDDDTIVRKVLDFLQRVTGINATPQFSKVFRWNDSLPQYTVGHLDRVAQLSEMLNGHKGMFLVGSAYHGVGLPDCVHDASLTSESLLTYFGNRNAE